MGQTSFTAASECDILHVPGAELCKQWNNMVMTVFYHSCYVADSWLLLAAFKSRCFGSHSVKRQSLASAFLHAASLRLYKRLICCLVTTSAAVSKGGRLWQSHYGSGMFTETSETHQGFKLGFFLLPNGFLMESKQYLAPDREIYMLDAGWYIGFTCFHSEDLQKSL